MKKLRALLVIFLGICILAACTDTPQPLNLPDIALERDALVPIPKELQEGEGAFGLDQFTSISTAANPDLQKIAEFLSQEVAGRIPLKIPVNSTGDSLVRTIALNLGTPKYDNNEAYDLIINADSVVITSLTPEGAFRGVQTLLQLVPEEGIDTLAAHTLYPIGAGAIFDAPNFEYRGSMLDVARHFFSVEDVKKYIDFLAYYKMNVLHLHLTDDQGWRIQIDAYPELTGIGASTEVGGEAGGFYTKDDYKELVAYAAARYITIIPEVDMPGHTNAASVSYPFLDGTGKPLKPYEGTLVGFSTFDTRKDTVYAFIDKVIEEIAAITPGPYFHIGGDESHSTAKADYRYFVNRVGQLVEKHGKIMIGWDEIANAEVSPTAIAQFWSEEQNARTAVQKNMKVIMSPAKKAYLDMQYDSLSKHGLHWAAYIPVDSAYNWDPETYSEGIPRENILGIEAPLWSETISNISELEYLAFPRLIGYAELGWSDRNLRDWEDYKRRLIRQVPHLERNNVQFYRSPKIDWPD